MMTSVILIILLFLLSVLFALFYYKNRTEKMALRLQLLNEREENEKLKQNPNNNKEVIDSEKTREEKKKMEEKNRKLFQMSETVYREKKKVEEQNEILLKEKTLLEEEKKKFQEKTKKLWQQSVAIHKEKERIDILKKEIEKKHEDILDSINYAKKIQEAILTTDEYLKENLPEYFILYKPRDIVSGDFYWAYKTREGKILFLCADSTGHGVPGAFMSMIGNALIDETVIEKNIHRPDEILNEMRKAVIKALKQKGHSGEQKDGMDGAIICLSPSEHGVSLTASCANNPVWAIKGKESRELIELPPDRQPISINYDMYPFTLHETILQEGDTVYMMTDGFEDQFGGAKGKKFKAAKLKEIILSIQDKSMLDQKSILENELKEWQGNYFQVDDILLVGIRI